MTGVLCAPVAEENPYQELLARHLADRGYRLRLRPLSWRTPGELRADEALVHLHWLAPLFSDPRRARTALKLAWLVRGLGRLRRRGVPLVWTVHNLYEHERVHTDLERRLRAWLARNASVLVVHGAAAAALVRREYGIAEPERIAIVPHGHYIGAYPPGPARPEARRRLGLHPTAPTLLFLGQVSPYKGVQSLVRAVARFGGSGAEAVQLVVAGRPCPPELAEELRALARGLDSVHLRLEFVPDAELTTYLSACDLFVLPHKEAPDGSGDRADHRFEILTSGSAILAMSLGRACLAPRNGCFEELFGDEGAFLHDPAREDGLEVALQHALGRRERWDAMGARNRSAIEPFGWERVAEETAAVYARALRAP